MFSTNDNQFIFQEEKVKVSVCIKCAQMTKTIPLFKLDYFKSK